MRYVEDEDVLLTYEVHEPVLPQYSIPWCVCQGRIETDTTKARLTFVRRHGHDQIDIEFLRGGHQSCMLIEDLSVLWHRVEALPEIEDGIDGRCFCGEVILEIVRQTLDHGKHGGELRGDDVADRLSMGLVVACAEG